MSALERKGREGFHLYAFAFLREDLNWSLIILEMAS